MSKSLECVTRITSERIYLDENQVSDFDESFKVFNQAKYFAYNESYKDNEPSCTVSSESLHMRVKMCFGLNTYYTNSAVRLGEGAFKSQKTVQADHMKSLEQKVSDVKHKLSCRKAEITKKQNEINKLLAYIQELRNNPDKKHKLKLNCFNGTEIVGYTVKKGVKRKKGPKETTLYKFLYEDLYPALRYARNKYKQTLYFQNNTLQKLENAKKLKRIWFLQNNPQARYNHIQLSGRADSKNKNFAVKVTPTELLNPDRSKTYKFSVQFQLCNGKWKNFETMFPYGAEKLADALDVRNKLPVTFGLIKKYDEKRKVWYLLFEAIFDLRKSTPIPADLVKGAFGIDLNIGHVDWCETNSIGNIINYGSLLYEVNGTSEENAVSLNKALREIAQHAGKVGKPIIIERLDTTKSKWKSTYRNKHLNRVYHLFPYARYTRMITWLALEYGTEVFEVNPAMTSKIGSLKYARSRKLPSHIAASYVIARRGQHFNEKIPSQWKKLTGKGSNWKQWSTLWKANEKLVKKKFDHPNNERFKSNILLPGFIQKPALIETF